MRCLMFSIWAVAFQLIVVQGTFPVPLRGSDETIQAKESNGFSRNSRHRFGARAHQTQSNELAQLQQKQLTSLNKDKCLKFKTVKERSECLLILLEMYYGSGITVTCPQLHVVLAVYNCTGCPWDKTPSALREKYPLPLPPSFFHEAESVADWLIILLNTGHGDLWPAMFTRWG